MNKTDEALSKILNSLADKFGTTVDHLYAIMIKQAFIDGIECLIAWAIMTTVAIIMGIKFYKGYTNYVKPEAYYADTYVEKNATFVIIALFLIVGGVVTFFVAGSTAIDCFFNPEYYALHHIINN